MTLTNSLVFRALGMGFSMVPSIQLKTVLLAQMASASINTAVNVNPGLLRSCRRAKRTSRSNPVMTSPRMDSLLEERCSWGMRVLPTMIARCAPKHASGQLAYLLLFETHHEARLNSFRCPYALDTVRFRTAA